MTFSENIRAPDPSAPDPGTPQRVWGMWRLAGLIVSALVLAIGLSLFSMRAYAAFIPVPGVQGPHLQLLSDPYPAYFSDLTPGPLSQWQIEARTSDPAGTLTVEFAPTGALITQPIDGLQIQVQRCDAVWTNLSTNPYCSDSSQNVFGPAAANTMPLGTAIDLGGITAAKGKFLLVTLWLPDTPYARADKSLQGLSGSIGLGLTAAGTTATTTTTVGSGTPPPTVTATKKLALTGADALPLALLALGTAGIGTVIAGARKIRAANAGRATS